MKEAKMMKVYAVTSGIYSDYGIEALFSSKEKAEEFMRLFPRRTPEYNDPEEYVLNPDAVDHVKKGRSLWVVTMSRDGSVSEAYKKGNDCWSLYGPPEIVERKTGGRAPEKVLRVMAWAKTEEQALKIANGQRARMIAKGEWDAD